MSLGKQPDPHTDAADAAIRAMQGRWRLAGVLLIAGLALLVYFPSLSGGFVLDDDIYLKDNPFIRAADGLYRFWCTTEPLDYYPVSNTTLWLEWRLWGMNPTGYHLTNLALHIAAALLIWVILRKLLHPRRFSGGAVVRGAPGECRIGGLDFAAQRTARAGIFLVVDLLVSAR